MVRRKLMGGAAYPVHLVAVGGAEADPNLPISSLAAYIPGAAADIDAPAINTAAVVTYGALAGLRYVITGVAWSYEGGVPVGGNLLVTVAGVGVFIVDIVEEGPGFFVFPFPKAGGVNAPMVITLAAGGATITGMVSILNHYQEA